MIRTIVILVVMVLINAAMVFAIMRLSKRTSDNMRKFFLARFGEVLPVEKAPTEENSNANVQNDATNKTIEYQYADVDIDKSNYKNKSFKNEYRNIKEEMNFDRSDVIFEVMSNHDDEINKYAKAIEKINNELDFDTVYRLSTTDSDIQVSVLKDVFDTKENEFLNSYLSSLNGKKFNISSFSNYVKEQASLLDENYYVKTGSNEESYDNLGDKVVTVHDDDIVEGIKVVHKNKVYDYSI